MSRRVHIVLTDRQHEYLTHASDRTGLSLGELVRRALDTKYPAGAAGAQSASEFTVAVWRRPHAASGRRHGVAFDRKRASS